jgi:hypothetical protein
VNDDRGSAETFHLPSSPVGQLRPRFDPQNHPHPMAFNGILPRQSRRADAVGPNPRSGAPRWLLIPLILALLLCVPAALAVVAVPMYLHQQQNAAFEATQVRLPATFQGVAQNTKGKAQKLAQRYAGGRITPTDVAVYGPVRDAVVILALKPPSALSRDQQKAERDSIERTFAAAGTPVFLIREAEGSDLGGWVGCGNTAQGLEICLATSVGSLVAVITEADQGNDPVDLLRQARAATVSITPR